MSKMTSTQPTPESEVIEVIREAAKSWKYAAPMLNGVRICGEFAFRLGDGDVSRHTMDRLASLFGGAIGRRLTYKELTQCPVQ